MNKLVSVDTPDNYTVIVRYLVPFPAFLGFLAWYYWKYSKVLEVVSNQVC